MDPEKRTSVGMNNVLIAQIEQEIAQSEFDRATNDIDAYLSVTQSLEGLLRNEKVVYQLKDFMVDERCEENIMFLLEVDEYKKIRQDPNYKSELLSMFSSRESFILRKAGQIVNSYLVPGSSYSQLYIPLPIIREFHKDYKPWEKKVDVPTEADLPPVTIFDKIEKIVLESVRKTSYQKFTRLANRNQLLAMALQGIEIQSSTDML